ncbi:hypothetical protein DL96DRAFT_1559157 [Flagelloscypha sp. PMI_526]|nr:hypothetical protein DL96DRAFT_1559157 [Flagelloscypha sp. PMI_526]
MADVVIIDSDEFQLSDRNKWIRNGLPREYGASTFYATEVGLNWSYTFVGSTVEVLGSIRQGLPNTDVEFYVDGSLSKTFTSPTINITERSRWHQSLFKKSGLDPNTNHTIQGRQATLPDPTQKGPIFFDYILYTPSAKTVFDKTTRFFIDERDSRVNFAKPNPQDWVLQNDGAFSYDDFFGRGVTNTTDPENIVTFSFTGTKIEVYGCKDVNFTPRLNFTLDGQSPDIIQLQGEPEYQRRYNVALWESPVVDGNTEHTVQMNHVNGSNGGMCLDYFLVTPATQSPGFFEKTGPPAYAIVLPVLTGVLGLVVLIGVLVWYIRKRRKARSVHQRSISSEEEIKPYTQGLSFNLAAPEAVVTPFEDTSSSRRIPVTQKSLEGLGTIPSLRPHGAAASYVSSSDEPPSSTWEVANAPDGASLTGGSDAYSPRLQPVRLRVENE